MLKTLSLKLSRRDAAEINFAIIKFNKLKPAKKVRLATILRDGDINGGEWLLASFDVMKLMADAGVRERTNYINKFSGESFSYYSIFTHLRPAKARVIGEYFRTHLSREPDSYTIEPAYI